MITYNEIYEASRKERYSEQLQRLPKSFVSDFAMYLEEKKELAAKEDVFSDVAIKTKKQLENAVTLFRELMLRRRKKILNLVLVAAETGISKQDFDNLLDFERVLFEDIMKCMDASDKNLTNQMKGKEIIESQKNSLVVFLEDIGELLSLEGDKIGPFDAGQIANIPNEIAEILLADKKCERVEK